MALPSTPLLSLTLSTGSRALKYFMTYSYGISLYSARALARSKIRQYGTSTYGVIVSVVVRCPF
eukprot:scaffold97474_cov38-Prasinocladus_malaysianus.AAC.1